jgi:hypothetical protein
MSIQAKTGLLGAVCQGLGAADDEEVTHLETLLHLDLPIERAQPQREYALVRHTLRHHEGHEALLAGADGGLHHHRGVVVRVDGHRHLGKSAGAQLVRARVVDAGRDHHHTRGRVGGLRHVGDHGVERLTLVAHGEADLLLAQQAGGVELGHLEADQQRVAPQQRGHRGPRLHVLPGAHVAALDLPGDRRTDEGVAEVELGQVQLRLGGCSRGVLRGHARAHGLDLLGLHQPGALLVGLLSSLERGLGLGQLGLGAGHRSLRALHGDLEAAWLDLHQHLPGLHAIALGEVELVHGAGDPRRDLHLLEGLDRAHRAHRILHAPRAHGLDLHRELQGLSAPAAGGRCTGLASSAGRATLTSGVALAAAAGAAGQEPRDQRGRE